MRYLKVQTTIPIIVFFFISLAASPSKGKVVDRIVAIVNNECITLSELKAYASDILRRTNQKDRVIDDNLLAQLLPQLIDQRLISQEIKKRGIKVGKREVDMAIQDILTRNRLTMDQLRWMLKSEGKDLKSYRKEIKTQIEHLRLVSSEVRNQIVVTDEEVEAYLKKHPKKDPSKGLVYSIQDIFIGFDDKSMDRKRALIIAKETLEAIRRGDETVSSKFKDMGSFTLSEMAPFVRNHVKNLKKGEVSEVVETDSGFHIFRVKDIFKTKQESLSARKEEIRQKLFQERLDHRFQEWLQGLRQKASIRILL